jgi:tripartite-type tricarboxylate transporter receptor subunit TctC
MPALGSPVSDNRVWVAGPNSTVRNLADLQNFNGTFRFAVSGLGAGSAQMVDLLARAGYSVANVTGFEGTGDQILSVLRGEVQGMNGTYPAQKQVIDDENLVIFAKLGNHPDLRGIDDVREVLEGDFRTLANILAAPLLAGRPFFTTPGTPPEVVEILRKGFFDTVHSEEYIRDLTQLGEELSYSSPAEIEESFRATLNAPDHIIELFRK